MNVYGFQEAELEKDYKISCSLRIHDLHHLDYSEAYKHFYIRKIEEHPKGNPGKGVGKTFETIIMLPIPVKTEDHVDDFMKAFRIEKD